MHVFRLWMRERGGLSSTTVNIFMEAGQVLKVKEGSDWLIVPFILMLEYFSSGAHLFGSPFISPLYFRFLSRFSVIMQNFVVST